MVYLHPPSTMELTNKKIIVGGWPAFAEASGVNKKEPVENFDWMPSESDKFYYTDMRAALDAVEGAREWLKNYTFDKNKESYPYTCSMAQQVSKRMSQMHSGASGSCILSSYRHALKDWDTFVLKTKESVGLRAYKNQQVPLWKIRQIIDDCRTWISTGDLSEKKEIAEKILADCASLCLTGMEIPEIRSSLLLLEIDLNIIILEDHKKRVEEKHNDLMGSIEFLYEQPIRWFDGPSGCSLSPVHPTFITKRAMDEMEAKFPGYDKHIENVLVAMGSPRKPKVSAWSKEGYGEWTSFLKGQKVIA
jgi:hypothetical protein